MQMLYNSDSFVVVAFDAPSDDDTDASTPHAERLTRGGYEIVDKFAGKEIFIEGTLAENFRHGVNALMQTSPSEEEMDDYLDRYTSLMQQPVVMH
jgi:hypothetical protein